MLFSHDIRIINKTGVKRSRQSSDDGPNNDQGGGPTSNPLPDLQILRSDPIRLKRLIHENAV